MIRKHCSISLFLLQPTLWREGETRFKGASSLKENTRELPPTYFRGKCQKNQKKGSANFKNKGSGIAYARGWYQHPTCPSQGTTTFNQVCKIKTSIFIYFPFFMFFYFLGLTRALPLLLCILKCDEELRPTQFFTSKKTSCVELILNF